MNDTLAENGGQEHDIASPDRRSGAAMVDRAGALEADQHPRHADCSNGKRRVAVQPPNVELVAGDEALAVPWSRRLEPWCNRAARTLAWVDAGERLVNLQWPEFAGPGVNVIPVKESKRHIAVLLDLEHDDIATE